MTNIASVVKLLQREHDRLTKQVKGIAAALEAFGSAYGKRNHSKDLSRWTREHRSGSKSTMGKGKGYAKETSHVCDCQEANRRSTKKALVCLEG